MKSIFSADEEQEPTEFGINSKFARQFERKKEHRELMELREKHGDIPLDSSDDSEEDSEDDSEIEDEFGEDLTPAIDAQILKTIASIKSKDPVVYDPATTFFKEEQLDVLDQKARELNVPQHIALAPEKPLLIRDYQRQTILEGNVPGDIPQENRPVKTHLDDQQELKEAFKEAAQALEDGDEDEAGFQLFSKQKSAEELEREETDYKDWLLHNLKEDNNSKTVFKDWISVQQERDVVLDKDESFLMNFIFNREWIGKDDKKIEDADILEEDQEHVEKSDNFESAYNFRYEQIEATQGRGSSYASNLYGLTTHARQIPESVRKEEATRAEKKRLADERKALEKLKKKEEISRLKALKRKELNEYAQKIAKWSGLPAARGTDEVVEKLIGQMDAEEEFDDANWDKMMAQVFTDSYYDEDETVKPVFEDDDDPIDRKFASVDFNEFEYAAGDANDDDDDQVVAEADDENFCMDADCLPEPQPMDEEQIEATKSALQTLVEQYNKLEEKDLIGENGTKFRYRSVEKDSFGLDPELILKADDADLNKYLSLKKLAPFRTSERDQEWISKWKRSNKNRKRDFLKKLEKDLKAAEKAQRKAERRAAKEALALEEGGDKKKKKEKRKRTEQQRDEEKVAPAVAVEEVKPAKKSKKAKATEEATLETVSAETAPVSKKKKVKTDIKLEPSRLSSYGF